MLLKRRGMSWSSNISISSIISPQAATLSYFYQRQNVTCDSFCQHWSHLYKNHITSLMNFIVLNFAVDSLNINVSIGIYNLDKLFVVRVGMR